MPISVDDRERTTPERPDDDEINSRLVRSQDLTNLSYSE
jgi:hypothetical protein